MRTSSILFFVLFPWLLNAQETPSLYAHRDPFLAAYFPGDQIHFSAGTYSEGNFTYFWDMGDQNQRTGDVVEYSYPQPGEYRVSVFAQNDQGQQTDTLYQTIFVNPTEGDFNVSVWVVSPEQDELLVKAGDQIQFEAGANREDFTFFWQFGQTDLVNRNRSFTLTIPEGLENTWVDVLLTGVSGEGIAPTYYYVFSLYIYGDNHPPDGAILVPPDIEDGLFRMGLGETASFQAQGSDPDNDLPLSYFWEIGQPDGQALNFETATIDFQPTQTGQHYCCVTVYDAKEAQDPFVPCFDILVKDGNQPPQGFFHPTSGTYDPGYEICFSADGEDPDRDLITYHWDFGDGRTATGEEVKLSYEQPGVYIVTLTATDSDGEADPTPFSRYVFINDPAVYEFNQAPWASIVTPEDGSTHPVQTDVSFQGFGYDPEEEELEFFWDFGDGSLGTGESITKRYDQICFSYGEFCSFDVQLFARDSAGSVSFYGDFIRVVPYQGEQPPDGRIVEPVLDDGNDGEMDFEEPLFQLRAGQNLVLKGGVEGVNDLTGYTAQWHYYTDTGSQQFSGFEPDPIAFEDFEQPGFYDLFLTVTAPSGLSDPVPAVLPLWVRAGNTAPKYVSILEPGWDFSIPQGDGIDLAAYADDEDRDPITFLWTISEVSGTVPEFTLTGERIHHVAFEQTGLYRIRLTATDSEGASTQTLESRYLVVLPNQDEEEEYNYPPEVRPIRPADTIVVAPFNSRITFQGQGYDAEDDPIAQIYWDFGNGQTGAMANPGSTLYANPGYYQAKAFAQGTDGRWSEYPFLWELYIYGDNIPPTGKIVDPPMVDHPDDFIKRLVPVLTGSSLVFQGQGNDTDGNYPLTGEWFLEYDGCPGCRTNFTPPGNAVSPEFQFPEQGFYSVNFQVTDSAGEEDPFGDYRQVLALDPEDKPETYIIEPQQDITLAVGESWYFFGYGEHPLGLPLTYEWDFGPNAVVPQEAFQNDVYPVVFTQASPEGQPYVVTLKSKFEFVQNGQTIVIEDDTPATVRITVKQFQDSDFEPNNSLAAAAALDQQGGYNNLSLNGAEGDTCDYFVFAVTEPEKDLSLDLGSTVEDVPLLLSLYRFDETQSDWQVIETEILNLGSGSFKLESLLTGNYAIEVCLTGENKEATPGFSYSFGVATLEPSLFLPLFVEDGNLSSTFGIINTTAETADIVVVGVDDQGRTLITKTLELPPFGRCYKSGLTFFGSSNQMEYARDIRWIKVQSTQRLVGYTNAETRDKTQMMSVSAIRSLAPGIVVPHVAERTETWYTRAVMINVDEANHPIDFDSPDVSQEISAGLGSNRQVDFRFRDRFPSLPQWGQFKSRTQKASISGVEMFGRVDGINQLVGLELINPRSKNPNYTRVNGDIYFSHIAQNPDWFTGMTLINLDAETANYNVVGYNAAGNEVVRLNGETLGPGSKKQGLPAAFLGNDQGVVWMKIETDANMAGFELFGDNGGKILAGFKADRSLTDTLYFPHIQAVAEASFTGINILNVSSEAVDLRITGYNDSGTVLAEVTVPVEAFGKFVSVAERVFGPGLPEGLTYVRVVAHQRQAPFAPIRVLNGFELFGTLARENDAVVFGQLMGGLPGLRK